MKVKKTIPFDIERAKAGAKLVTRDGRNVRILCYDKKTDNRRPIVALVDDEDEDEERVTFYRLDGSYFDAGIECPLDLLIEVNVETKCEYHETTKRITKAKLQMLELIENDPKYGGVVTDEERENQDFTTAYIDYENGKFRVFECEFPTLRDLIFHTKAQAELFIKDHEELLKEFFR